MKARTFLKFFLTFLVIFTLIGIPLIKAVSNVNLFQSDSTGDSTADSEGMLVDGSGTFYDKYSDVNRINLLMLGVNDKMTDTIMLLSWDLDNDNVDVISVPRDTYYHRDGYDGAAERKINSIYASQGVKPTAEAVSDVLYGIPINYYAIITYDAVEKIVDGIGGVPIYVKQDMHYEDPYDDPPLVIDIDKGQQTLDGEHAVQYLRYRHGYANGDLGRVEAQQTFMKALYKQCIKHGVISSAKLITDNIKSDLTLGAVSQYALSAMKLDENSISTYTVPGEGKYIGSTSYYVQDKDATKDMLNEIYSGIASDSGSSSSN